MNIFHQIFDRFRSKLKQYISDYPMPACLATVILLTSIEARLVMLIHSGHFNSLVDAAYGVVMRMPHWRGYQNRLLGPWLVQFISQFTGWTFTGSFKAFIVMSLALANFVSFCLFFGLTRNRLVALKYTFYFSFCFLALQDSFWLYPWDLMDITIFFIFAYGIFKNWNTRFFVYLFVVSLLNKESALFINLWLIIDAFKYEIRPSEDIQTKRIKINYPKLLLGIFLAAVGIFYTKFLRDWLFIKSSIPWVGLDLSHALNGQDIVLLANINCLFKFWLQKNIHILPAFLFIGLTVYMLIKMRFNQFLIKVMLLFLCMLLSIFVFSLIDETRAFFILIPFVLILNLEFSDKIRFERKI